MARGPPPLNRQADLVEPEAYGRTSLEAEKTGTFYLPNSKLKLHSTASRWLVLRSILVADEEDNLGGPQVGQEVHLFAIAFHQRDAAENLCSVIATEILEIGDG